jgi:hypothetical protein
MDWIDKAGHPRKIPTTHLCHRLSPTEGNRAAGSIGTLVQTVIHVLYFRNGP